MEMTAPLPHTQAQHNGGKECHQGVRRAHGGQSVRSEEAAHHPGIGNVIHLLQEVAAHQRQGKQQHIAGNGPLGKTALHDKRILLFRFFPTPVLCFQAEALPVFQRSTVFHLAECFNKVAAIRKTALGPDLPGLEAGGTEEFGGLFHPYCLTYWMGVVPSSCRNERRQALSLRATQAAIFSTVSSSA